MRVRTILAGAFRKPLTLVLSPSSRGEATRAQANIDGLQRCCRVVTPRLILQIQTFVCLGHDLIHHGFHVLSAFPHH